MQSFDEGLLSRRRLLGGVSLAALSPAGRARAKPSRPNVVFIVCDDLNDSVEGMGGHPQAKTPNIHRLMERGVQFTNAHSNAPICAPARACLFSGIYPHHSDVVEFRPFSSSEVLKNSVTMFEHFKDNGYSIYGAGKLFHYHNEFAHLWRNGDGTSNYGPLTEYGPFPFNGEKANMEVVHPSLKFIEDLIPNHDSKLWQARGEHSFAPLSDVPAEPKYPGWKGWRYYNRQFRYVSDTDRDLMPDELSAGFAAEILSRRHEKPFLLGVGLMKPHTPLYAPEKYFQMFPLEKIQLPPFKGDDLDDCQDFLNLISQYGFERHALYERADLWKRFLQAYLACTAFVDEQVGVVLNAIEKSAYRDNTVVVLTGDHGFHMGEKRYNFKLSNWEESTRVPMVVAAPGARKGSSCNHPVSHVDLYPTLIDYCALPKNPNAGRSGQALGGYSMRPFVENPSGGKWNGPDVALTAVYGATGANGKPCRNYSVRSRRWRYTLYQNGAEELYDHQNDPNEWSNLAKDRTHSNTKAELKKTLLAMLKPKS